MLSSAHFTTEALVMLHRYGMGFEHVRLIGDPIILMDEANVPIAAVALIVKSNADQLQPAIVAAPPELQNLAGRGKELVEIKVEPDAPPPEQRVFFGEANTSDISQVALVITNLLFHDTIRVFVTRNGNDTDILNAVLNCIPPGKSAPIFGLVPIMGLCCVPHQKTIVYKSNLETARWVTAKDRDYMICRKRILTMPTEGHDLESEADEGFDYEKTSNPIVIHLRPRTDADLRGPKGAAKPAPIGAKQRAKGAKGAKPEKMVMPKIEQFQPDAPRQAIDRLHDDIKKSYFH